MKTFATADDSIAHTKGLFAAAVQSGSVLRTKKQFYSVSIRRIDDPNGELVSSKENRAGEQGKQGDWVLERLDANGATVIAKDGGPTRWVASEKAVLKTYDVSDEVKAAGKGVVWTKKGNIVHMVKLTEDIQIKTSWGTMDGHAGAYLPNYDYDEAKSTAGNDYAIVASDDWDATYEIA